VSDLTTGGDGLPAGGHVTRSEAPLPRETARETALLPLRLVAVASTVLVVMVASACATTSAPGGTTSPSTFGADSPWLGPFTPAALPALVNSLGALDCVSASRCWAVGSTIGSAGAPNGAAVIATTNGGISWVSQTIPPTVGFLSDIACSDQKRCTAVGQATPTSDGQAAIIGTVDGGTVWTPEPTPPGILDLTAVTCRTSGRCVAIGSTGGGVVALVSATTGTTWSQEGALPANTTGATDISCSDELTCFVTAHAAADLDHVTGTVAVSVDGGATWSAVTMPPGIGSLNGISCLGGPVTGSGALPTTTVAPTTSLAAPSPATAPTTTTPTTTTAATTPVAPPPTGVAGANCTVVGTTANTLNGTRTGHGLLLTTENGGASWSVRPVSAASASLADVSCTAIGSCVAVGDSVATSDKAGMVILSGTPAQPWKKPAVVGAPQPLTAVSCVSSSSCVVVGESFSEHLAGG
jgi:hypothetical protein